MMVGDKDDGLDDVRRMLDLALRCELTADGDGRQARALMRAALDGAPDLKAALLRRGAERVLGAAPVGHRGAARPDNRLDAVYDRIFADGRRISFTGHELLDAIDDLVRPLAVAEPTLGRDEAFARLGDCGDDLLRQIEKRRAG